MAKLTWQVIEDNGGGLHLAVFNDGQCIYYTYGYEQTARSALRNDLNALKSGVDPREDGWDMPADVDDPQRWYDELTSRPTPSGWQAVAGNDGVYYDRMGTAARRVFMVPWQELELFDRDNDPVTDQEQIRAALREFRETGGIDGYFFARIGWPHEDEDNASTWGPPSPDAVDWDGFDGGGRE